jgi:hypothetical protein
MVICAPFAARFVESYPRTLPVAASAFGLGALSYFLTIVKLLVKFERAEQKRIWMTPDGFIVI